MDYKQGEPGPRGLRAAFGRQEPRAVVTKGMLDDRSRPALRVSEEYWPLGCQSDARDDTPGTQTQLSSVILICLASLGLSLVFCKTGRKTPAPLEMLLAGTLPKAINQSSSFPGCETLLSYFPHP